MKELYEQRKLKKIFHSRYTLIVLCIVIVLIFRGVFGVYEKHEKSKEILKRAQYDLALLQEREQSITRSMESLNTEYGKERELRDRFGVIKEGENIVIIVDETVDDGIRPLQEKTWWQSFLELFK